METLCFAIFFGLMALSVPIPITMITAALVAYVFIAHIPAIAVAQGFAFAVRSYAMAAILFFVFAGSVMMRGKLATTITNLANALVGFIPGGLALSGVVACGIFGAISGSSTAALAAIGTIMVPALIANKWPANFSIGLMTSAGILAMIIPPSIPVILYCVPTNISVGALFLSGVLPGIIIIIIYSIYLYFKAKDLGIETTEVPTLKGIFKAIRESIWALGLVIVIFGGIYSGIFTVTESAGIGALYAILVELFIFRNVKLRDIPMIAVESAATTGVILFIMGSASVFSQYLTLQLVPMKIATWILSISQSKWVFLLLTNIFLLIVGMLVDSVSAILILAPLFLPIYKLYGMNDLQFGMMFLLNLYIGYMTPPVGYSLFAAVAIFRVPLVEVAKNSFQYVLMMLIALILVILFPDLSTWIPKLVYGR
jgi:C4-dicarboxylate transporter DctM subunit